MTDIGAATIKVDVQINGRGEEPYIVRFVAVCGDETIAGEPMSIKSGLRGEFRGYDFSVPAGTWAVYAEVERRKSEAKTVSVIDGEEKRVNLLFDV
jgi:hypothetical protein